MELCCWLSPCPPGGSGLAWPNTGAPSVPSASGSGPLHCSGEIGSVLCRERQQTSRPHVAPSAPPNSPQGVLGCKALTRLPRRLLLRLPPEPTRLWHSASNPRMPPTQSPSSTTCRDHRSMGRVTPPNPPCRVTAGPQSQASPQIPPHLATEAIAFSRVQEGCVGLVGTGDDGAHSVLVGA